MTGQAIAVFVLLAASFPSFISATTQYNNDAHPEAILFGPADMSGAGTRIRGMRETRNADFILGGLFPVHSRGYCERFNRINIVEAMLFALDTINSDPNLLPNITFGYDIRDTCFIEQVGLDETADLIITPMQGTCTATVGESANQTQTVANTTLITIGLVGAASSSVSIPIAGLTRLFTVPQVSFASTSDILGDRERYPYFYRTIPSDALEVQALIDVIQHFGWTYISTIFSRNTYGRFGIDGLVRIAGERGICIDLNEGIDETASVSDYRKIADKLSRSTANVVVFYSTRQHVQELFKHIKNITTRHFTWIGSGGWTQLADEFPPSVVSGFFGVLPVSNHHANSFHSYYSNLTLKSNLRDPWFPEFFHTFFNCSGDDCPLAGVTSGSNDFFVPLVIDAVYTHAHALQNYLNDICGSPVVWNRETTSCNGQNGTFDRSNLLQYVANVNFTSLTGNHVFFNQEGSVKSFRYRVTNYQAKTEQNISYSLENIGMWNSEFQAFDVSQGTPVQFFDSSGAIIPEAVSSACSSCAPGQYIRRIDSACCGLCDSCLGELFSNSSLASNCSNCSEYGEMWGNIPTVGSNGCVEIPKVFLSFSHPFAIVVSAGSVLGIILLIVAVILLAVFWNSPVIRASSRESVILILIGAASSFLTSFIYLSTPSLAICILQRILLWFCFSLMNGSLLVKVIRITRIFVFERLRTKQLKCVQWYHQVLSSLLIVCGQMVIVLLSVTIVNPNVLRELRLNTMNLNSLPEIIVTCEAEPILGFIVSVLYEAGLILITVILGTMTFKSPANFNESKTICVSAYILLTIWTMFFISYFFTGSARGLQNAFIALTTTLGAYTILVSVIGPRLFTVIFRKDEDSKNTQTYDVSPAVTMNTMNSNTVTISNVQ